MARSSQLPSATPMTDKLRSDKSHSDKSAEAAAAPDYAQTLFLPQTEFPMRAGLPQREPELLARWARIELYRKLREAAKVRHSWRNSRIGTSSLFLPLARYCSSIFHSIGSPWQSQPGT